MYSNLQTAINDSLGPGVTIEVGPGTYRPSATIQIYNKNGTAAQPARLRAASGALVILDCADAYDTTSKWVQHSGNVWRAARTSAVVDTPETGVFVDSLRYLNKPGTAYASLGFGQYRYNDGVDSIYVNVGGGNPGAKATYLVNDNRRVGIQVDTTSYLTIEGLTVVHSPRTGIQIRGNSRVTCVQDTIRNCNVPGGHPKSPTCGHPKLLHLS